MILMDLEMPDASVPCANYVNVEGLFNRDGGRVSREKSRAHALAAAVF